MPKRRLGSNFVAPSTSECIVANIQECLMTSPDETSDVILVVEGRELHANRAVLAHYSPVFRRMFFSNFKEKTEKKVPLPDEKYDDMVLFFRVLFPRTSASEQLITDQNLIQLVRLADKYDAEEVKAKCEDYIKDEVSPYYYRYCPNSTGYSGVVPRSALDRFNSYSDGIPRGALDGLYKSELVIKLSLYMWACDNGLHKHRGKVKDLLVAACGNLTQLSDTKHYKSLSSDTKVEILECLCANFCKK